MILGLLCAGALMLIALGYLVRMIHTELIKWAAERRADRESSRSCDRDPNVTGWDQKESEAPKEEARVGRHRAREEAVPTGRVLVHATAGTYELPLVSSAPSSFVTTQMGRTLIEEGRRFRDRSAKNRPEPGRGLVPSASEAGVRGQGYRAQGRTSISGQPFERVPMPDWT